jgi:hypothetical protein
MPLVPRHVVCVAFKAEVFDLHDAGGPVGTEDQAKNLGNEIVEFHAVLRIGIISTIGAA